MPYDKYHNWPLPGLIRGPMEIGSHRSIEEQVLLDLKEAKEDIDKLEILDSYSCYAQRAYRQDFAESTARLVGQELGTILAPVFLSRLPEVMATHRARVGGSKLS